MGRVSDRCRFDDHGALIGTVLLSGRAVGPLAQLVGLAVRFQQAKAALQSLNKLMAMPVERPPEKSFLGAPTLAGNLLLKELQFHYPAAPGQTPTPVLDKINLHIMPGERVAILGRIGSGKSSLLRILARLYQPVGGQLFMDGIDAAQIDPADWRAHVGFVGQETRLFYGRLSENIMLGRPDASVDDVLRVARMTGVDRIAASHPHGYARIIGEMGEGLSGGQRQLVGLARCLLANPKILLMDEPTSSMDAQTEAIFMQHLSASLGPEQSLVLVTHRMSLLDVADRILVLDEGKIVADGPKEEVLRTLRNNAEKAAAQADATRHGRVAA